MKTNEKGPNPSRRAFVKTAAVALGGISSAAMAGVGSAAVEAAQAAPSPPAEDGAGRSDKLVITISPSGGGAGAAREARTPKRDADAALEGINAGASIVHLRGAISSPPGPMINTPDLDYWRELGESVRSRSDVVINFGASAMTPAVRKSLLALKPDAGSFLVGHHYAGMAVPVENQRQYAIDYLDAGVLPEVEVFHTGDVANLNALIKTGVMRPPYCVTIFINHARYYQVPPTASQLQSMLELLPPRTHWTVCVDGPKHLELAAYAIALGGHVRTGLENGVELAPGRLAKTQAECVERIVQLARDLGREVASPKEARAMLLLPRRPETVKG